MCQNCLSLKRDSFEAFEIFIAENESDINANDLQELHDIKKYFNL